MNNLTKVIRSCFVAGSVLSLLFIFSSCCSLGIFNGAFNGAVMKLPDCEHPGDTCYVLLLNEVTNSSSYLKFLSAGHPGDTCTYAWANICKGDYTLELARIDSLYQISDGTAGSKKNIGYYPDPTDSTILGIIEIRPFSTVNDVNIILN